jgi:type IV secretory pathway VirJ component
MGCSTINLPFANNNWSNNSLRHLFGSGKRRGMDVFTEVNKISNQKIVVLNSSDDKGLDAGKITINHITEVLPGGHHFDGDIDEIVKAIVKFI